MSESKSTLDDVQPDTEQEGTMPSTTSAKKMSAEEVYLAVKALVVNDDGSPGLSVKAATQQVAKQAGRSEDTVRETYYRRGRLDKNNVIKTRTKSRAARGSRRPSYIRMTEDGGVNGTSAKSDGKGSKGTRSMPKMPTSGIPTRAESNAAIEQALDAINHAFDILKRYRDGAETFEAIREQFTSV